MTSEHQSSPAADGRPVSIDRKSQGLTEFERQLLLKELAEVQAELDALRQRTSVIAARVTKNPASARLDRPA